MHTIIREQQINTTLDEAWNFFSQPVNLRKITPKELNFVIKTPSLFVMYPGLIIEYTVSPMFNIPLTWVTEITHVVEREMFIDIQLQGPYKVWHHQHFFIENEKGVLIKDILNYQLPFGILGEFITKFWVEKKVKEIFDYRFRVVNEIFNK